MSFHWDRMEFWRCQVMMVIHMRFLLIRSMMMAVSFSIQQFQGIRLIV